jgi:hypothetical protein
MADPWVSGNVLRALASPTKEDIASTLGAPVDLAAYFLKRLGVGIPTEYVSNSYNPDTDPIYGLQKLMGIAATGKPPPNPGYTRRPTGDVPFTSRVTLQTPFR